jgi:flavin reductase (DIM6/NTAB) family NADH-FMN oxidoreductase RutF
VTRVLVLGGGLAGMLTAAALMPYADEITVVEQDRLPDQPQPRKGLPQSPHNHMLLGGGAGAVEQLLPGTQDLLFAAGAHRRSYLDSILIRTNAGWGRRQTIDAYVIACSRDLIDHVVRRQVLGEGRIKTVQGASVLGLTGSATRVTGARIEVDGGSPETVTADLVVDATGHRSKTPAWLTGLGLPQVHEAFVDPGFAYSRRLYQAPPGLEEGFPGVLIQPEHGIGRPGVGAALMPNEDGRWMAVMIGTRGNRPPTDEEGFLRFARGERTRIVADLIAGARPRGLPRHRRRGHPGQPHLRHGHVGLRQERRGAARTRRPPRAGRRVLPQGAVRDRQGHRRAVADGAEHGPLVPRGAHQRQAARRGGHAEVQQPLHPGQHRQAAGGQRRVLQLGAHGQHRRPHAAGAAVVGPARHAAAAAHPRPGPRAVPAVPAGPGAGAGRRRRREGDPGMSGESQDRFRQAMAAFPSGVTIVTAADAKGGWWGFTASSFCSLSLRPPLVLVCLATDAQCHPVFADAASWVVNVAAPHHRDLAVRFATRGADKFAPGGFTAGSTGHPVLTDACAVLECVTFARYGGGDHTILVGEVVDTHVREEEPAVYFRRDFHRLTPTS